MKKEVGDNQPVTYGLLKSTLKSTLTQAFSDFGSQFGREMRDFVRQEDARLKKEIITEVLEGVGNIIDHGIHPQIDNHEHRITRLEAKV